MDKRKCLTRIPTWADAFYSGYNDLDDPEDAPRRPKVKPNLRRK